jgi:deoxyribonuclease-4
MRIGFHVSISGSIDKSVDRAEEIGCTSFQMFTRNPRSWKAKPLETREVEAFRRKIKASCIWPVFSHMPYIPNLASTNEKIYQKSVETLVEETNRCRTLGIPYIVTHLGSHTGAGKEKGKAQLVYALGLAIDEDGPTILIENSSGSGGHMGSTFEDIQDIVTSTGSSKICICLDTCHAYAAGYDIANVEGLKKTLRKIRKTIGFTHLKLIHLNDSVGELNSGVDHHEHIGLGRIGEEGFRLILNSQLSKRPLIMETPFDDRRTDRENMRKVLELTGLNS